MTMTSTADAMMAMADQEQVTERFDSNTAVELARNDTLAQLDAAHKYKRSVGRFLNEAVSLATISQDVAESCIYSLPRGGQMITGPSVRLAEICASAYGNLQIGARVVDVEETNIVAQGAAWDMQANLRCTIEVKRRITGKNGRRFNEDMITMTGNAAASIALRNAIFRVVPRAYIDTVFEKAREVAVGTAKTLSTRREQILQRFEKLGVSRERVLEKLERASADDVTLDDLTTLIGLGTAIKSGDSTIEEAFPVATPAPAAPEQDGKRIKMGAAKKQAEEREPGVD